MVLAYKKSKNIKNAIPVDIIELQNKSMDSYVVLNKGNDNIIVTNRKDQSFKYEIEVKQLWHILVIVNRGF